MSILSQLLKKQITFAQAEQKIGGWIAGLVTGNPTADAALASAESDLKQAASNAIALGSTAATTYLTPAVTAIEAAVDAAITSATKGIATPAIPLVNAGLDSLAAMLKSVVDAQVTQAKAALSTTAADATQAKAPVANTIPVTGFSLPTGTGVITTP